jgi:peptidoglycan/xylan/chitin deacetylase (PgdA/CDA1 family)
MYHRVIPFKEAIQGIQAGMYVEPETFYMHLRYLNKYFLIIPFSEMFLYLKNTSYNKGDKPICIITFDDGWYDFYKYAYPILKAQRVTATVFLPTKYIGTEDLFWTDRLTNLIVQNQQNKNYKDRKNKKHIDNLDVIEKIDRFEGTIDSKVERAISLLKKYSDENINVILENLKRKWGGDPIPSERAFLKWVEVQEMWDSGFINFGSHTNNHKMLTYLDNDEIMEELIQSKNKLITEKVVNPFFIPFSFPNGNYDERVINMVKEAGYQAAVTIDNGWNKKNTSHFNLHRVAVHQDMSSNKEMFACRITNLL